MKTPADLREQYGEVFVLELPDGQQVPFKLLQLKDYFSYSQSLDNGLIPPSIIENEIFQKCILDEVLIANIHKQKAGTPTSIANTILQYSAPRSGEELNYFLNYNRHVVQNILYQIVNIICLGFNGYTPDDILSKDIHEIMLLLAMAERKLLETGMLSEPLDFSGDVQKQEDKKPKKPKIDVSKLKDLYEQTQPEEFNLNKLHQEGKKRPETITENEIPNFEDQDKEGNTVISTAELMYNSRGTLEEEEIKTLREASVLFKDYVEQAKRGKVKIKTDEERIKEMEDRMKENKDKFKNQMRKHRK